MSDVSTDASSSAVRGLVVDDDPDIVDFMSTVLSGFGVQTQSALDGRQAEQWLRASQFDVLFLDMRLPIMSGELILQLLNQGVLRRPASIVLMSGQPDVIPPTPEEMARLGVAGFLGKPFAPADVRASLHHALQPKLLIADGGDAQQAGVAVPGTILIGGLGLWAASLSQVVSRCGGVLLSSSDAVGAREFINRQAPPTVILGPPLSAPELTELTTAAVNAHATVLVGLGRTDPALRAELLTLGARKVASLPTGLAELSTDMTLVAGLKRRAFPRAPLASAVLLHGGKQVIGGFAVDLGEGGLGLVRMTDAPSGERLRAEFALPGEDDLIEAVTEIAWVRPSDDQGLRAGVRFTDIEDRHRSRIRQYVETRAVAPR
jgi:CheY-like chemotaxis protein